MAFFKRTKIIDYSDEQLIIEIERGNEAAFNLLYERYSTRLFHYFLKFLGNDFGKAEDFLQELFIKVLNKASSFNPTAKASTWLYTIATNMCKNEWRNIENRQRILRQFEAWEYPAASVFQRLESLQLAKHLSTLINQLEYEERLIIQLRFQQEFSIREIATIMEIPEGTVKSRLFYLLKRLAAELKTNPICKT